MDKIAQRIFATATLLAVLFFGTATLIHTTTPAVADTKPSTINETGRYMMQFQAEYGTGMNWYFLVWDTVTGRSKFYFGSTGKPFKGAASSYQLPSSPL